MSLLKPMERPQTCAEEHLNTHKTVAPTHVCAYMAEGLSPLTKGISFVCGAQLRSVPPGGTTLRSTWE
jgi:hypothetical protein